MSGSCSWKKWLLYAEEASSVCLNLCSFAGCLSHSGPFRGCQAKGPGFSFLQHAPDSLPHLVPWGELRAKFLKVFILPTQSIHIQKHSYNFIPVVCFPSTFPSILLFFKVIGMLWLRKPSLHLPLGHALNASNSFFLLFLYGIPTFKDEGEKKKDLGSRFQSSARIYANSPCLGQEDVECSLLNGSQFLKQALEGMSKKHHFRGALEMSAHPVLVTIEK